MQKILLTALTLITLASGASAEQLLGSYVAYIGHEDTFNSRKQRLSTPAQVLRQDRANFHRFGIRHDGDETDPFFASAEGRAALERMVQNAGLGADEQYYIVSGNSWVVVRVFGEYGIGSRVTVELVN